MFPFGNYQKSLQDRQNSRGSPAIRRPDLYSPAEVEKRFLTFENPVKAVKQPPRAHCISISVCFSTEQLTSWPHDLIQCIPNFCHFYPECRFLPILHPIPRFWPILLSAVEVKSLIPPMNFAFFLNLVLNFGSTTGSWECHSRPSSGRQKCNVQQPHDTEGLNLQPSSDLKFNIKPSKKVIFYRQPSKLQSILNRQNVSR